jgi:hypothetical protein
MRGFEFVEEFPRRPDSSFSRVVQSLADASLLTGVCGNIEQSPIRFGALHDRRRPSLNGEHHGALALPELLQKNTL